MQGGSCSIIWVVSLPARHCRGAGNSTPCCAKPAPATPPRWPITATGWRPDDTAFLNATFNHANETDDTHLKSPTHPGQIAVPSAMALAEYAGADGERLLLAVIAAYEVMIRISWSCSPHLIYRGHHPPVGVGPFGAATAGAVILGFDA